MMIATKCPSPDQLRALSLGQIGDAHSDELFDHIRSCETCKAELETVECAEDSLIASLRSPDAWADFDAEPQRNVAMAKALGALALAADASTCDESSFLPQTIGEYEILRPLGRGGMGNVYLARHTKLGRQVALKVLAGHRLADARMRDRFEAEMRAVGRLSHPNVVTAHDAREVDGTAVLVTEYIDGLDLGQLVQRTGPLAVADACEIARQTAVALQYTSGQGFVHRDVKPANVMLSKSGEVKLLDLGLARWERDDPQQTGMTGTGQTMGTADYVAPEQVNDSRTVDVRADIYSLGCTLFKLLTGAAPFADAEHATVFAKMTAHVSQSAPRLGEALPAAPAGLVTLVDAMLAKEPAMRPQSPQAVAEELVRFARGSDLQQLATRAAALQPRRPQAAGDACSPASDALRTLPLLRRRVPLPLAIGGGLLGVLLGVFLGIFIKIQYPDGTEVTLPLPPGSKLTVGDTDAENTGASRVAPLAPPNGSAMKAPLEPVPLQFAVLIEKDVSASNHIIALARESANSDGSRPMPMWIGERRVGTWYPLAPDVTAPIEVTRGGQRYALATHEDDGVIRWDEIRGRISSVATSAGRLEMHFEGDLAKRVNEVSKNNLHRHLAIILGGRIIAAPRIVSELSDRVSLTGKFSEQEIRYLHDALNGLVTEPPREVAASDEGGAASSAQAAPAADPAEALQGVWRFVSIAAKDGAFPGGSTVMAFQGDNYYVCDADAVIGGGEFITTRRAKNLMEIEFRDQLIRTEPMDVFRGFYRVLPDGRVELRSDRLTQSPRPSPDAEEGSQGLVTNRLERLGGVPQTPEEARALGERMRGYQGHEEFVQALTTLAKVSQTPPTSLEAIASETEQGDAQSHENLRAIGIAFHNFHDVYNKFPGSSNTLEGSRGKRGHPFSWRVAILPFVEHQELFEQYRFDEPWDSEHNLTLIPKMPSVYRSPYGAERNSVRPLGETHYQGLVGEQTALGVGDGVPIREFTDGTSNTILIVETQSTVPWTKPQDLPFDTVKDIKNVLENQWLSFLTADGAVHTIDPIDWEKLPKLITRNGGEIVKP